MSFRSYIIRILPYNLGRGAVFFPLEFPGSVSLLLRPAIGKEVKSGEFTTFCTEIPRSCYIKHARSYYVIFPSLFLISFPFLLSIMDTFFNLLST